MDQFRALFASIRKNLGALTATQKLLIGSLAVIMLMTLFLVSQYSGKQTMVPLLPGASAEDQQKAAAVLRTANIKMIEGPTGILVPTEKREDAFALLGQSGNQPANTAIVFENLLKNQNWMNSREQNRQL
jgi:flagellar biosynthesis/type III secretory pathway M-ring protein FliF/YscJ